MDGFQTAACCKVQLLCKYQVCVVYYSQFRALSLDQAMRKSHHKTHRSRIRFVPALASDVQQLTLYAISSAFMSHSVCNNEWQRNVNRSQIELNEDLLSNGFPFVKGSLQIRL